MIAILALLSSVFSFSNPLAGQEQAAKPCIVILGQYEDSMVTPTHDLFNKEFSDLVLILRAEPSNTALSVLEDQYDYEFFQTPSTTVCYPKDLLGLDRLKQKTQLIQGFLNAKLSFGEILMSSALSSETSLALRNVIRYDGSNPYSLQLSKGPEVMAQVTCSMMLSMTTSTGTKSTYLTFPPPSSKGRIEDEPVVKELTPEEAARRRLVIHASSTTQFNSHFPLHTGEISDHAEALSTFLDNYSKKLRTASVDLISVEKKLFDRYIKEVLKMDPKDFPKDGIKFADLPEQMKSMMKTQMAGSYKVLGYENKEQAEQMLAGSTINTRYFQPSVSIWYRTPEGRSFGYGIAIGPGRRP